MNFNQKTFSIVTENKENALLWGQKIWFLLTDGYNNHSLDKRQTQELWIDNITLALIYKEFTVAALSSKMSIDWTSYLNSLSYEWDDLTLAFIAGQNHFNYSVIEDIDEAKRNALITQLVIKNKADIFYSLVKHYFSVNAMYEEFEKSVIDSTGKLPSNYDKMWGWEWAREDFTLMDFDAEDEIEE